MPDVLGYLRDKGFHLKNAGDRNVHTACIFCEEDPGKRGRLYIQVDPEAEIPALYFCHRCGAKGNLTTLKRHFGDVLDERDIDAGTRAEILNLAAAYYRMQLNKFTDVLDYLQGPRRGLLQATIDRHQIGYAPMGFNADITNRGVHRPWALSSVLHDAGFEYKDILATGLVVEREGKPPADALYGMITIPYMVGGNVVAIRGRTWPQSTEDFAEWQGLRYDPPPHKYKTLAGASTRLFNADVAWEADQIFVTEGEFDALVLEQEGYPTVGVPGANVWQPGWDAYLDKPKRVFLIFDRDEAGEKGAKKLTDRLGHKVRRVHLSEEGFKCDPTQWFATEGHTQDEFEELLQEANRGGLLVTVHEAIAEFSDIQGTPGLRFAWDDLDTHIAPGLHGGQLFMILAKSGTGKGHSLDTLVPTPDGLRTWGSLEVGDHVMGSDGNPTKVVGVYDRGWLPTYRVTFSDGTWADTDGDHIWAVRYRYGKRREWTAKNMTTAELAAADLRRGPEYRYTIPMCAPVAYRERVLPLDPYALGALIANGYLTGTSAVLVTPDSHVVERIRRHVEVTDVAYPEGACPRYTVRRTISIIRDLRLDIPSHKRFIPEPYLTASIDQRVALLQGLLDGDGTGSSPGRNCVRYSTTSLRLAQDLVRLVTSLGGTATQRWTERDGHAHHECEMSIMLPEGIEPFSLPRKQRAKTNGHHTEPRRAITAIEPLGEQLVRCIAVDAPDSLYLITPNHIVTHNTLVLLNMMHRARMFPGQEDLKILFVSLEQTRGEWWDRARRIHRFYNVDATQADAAAWWKDNILIVDRNRLSEAELRQVIDDYGYQMGRPPDLMCLDYMGYFARAFRGEAYERTSQAVMAVKGIAKEHRIPVIAPHQVSRQGHDGEEFEASAARDSGVIEETADFLLTMWSPDNAIGRDEAEKSGRIHFRIAKSRHGGRGEPLAMQMAPISLAMVPMLARDNLTTSIDPLGARARREYEWRRKVCTWEEAAYRHRTGMIDGKLDATDFEERWP